MKPTWDEQASAAAPSITDGLKNVAGDVLALTELQAELLKLDLTHFRQRSSKSLVIIAIASITLLAGLPVFMLALAHGIAELFELRIWHCMFIVAIVFSILSLVALVIGAYMLRAGLSVFERSVAEFRKNVGWVKAIVNKT